MMSSYTARISGVAASYAIKPSVAMCCLLKSRWRDSLTSAPRWYTTFMRQAALLASVAAMTAALLTDATVAGQEPGPGSGFVAFRVDGSHVVATLKVLDLRSGPR